MSGTATSLTITSTQKETKGSSVGFQTVEKTSTDVMENLKKSVYKYLNMNENIYGSQEPVQSCITVPWILPTSNIFEWWVRLKYNGETFQKQLDVSITDFQQKFLKHPILLRRCFF